MCLLQERLSYSVVWQLAEPHRLASPRTGSITTFSSPIILPSHHSPVQAAAAMLQQLQQHLLQQLQQHLLQGHSQQPMALQLPCLLSEDCSPSSAATASSQRTAAAAAAMAALIKVASSEASEGLVTIARSPHLPVSKPCRLSLQTIHQGLAGADLGLPASLASHLVGSHGAQMVDGCLHLPQISDNTQYNGSHGMHGQIPAGIPGPSLDSGDRPMGTQRGGAQHAFVTGGLGALGQLLALWLCLAGSSTGLSLVGRTGRAISDPGTGPHGYPPLWAQCLGLPGDDCPAVHMVRCDAAAQEESAAGLRCQGLWSGAPAVDSIFHAGEHHDNCQAPPDHLQRLCQLIT